VAEIQRNIIKQGQRNWLTRVVHVKNDKEKVATWRLDLNTIVHVFYVRGVTPARPPLTANFQTKLAINANVAVSKVHRNVLNPHNAPANTYSMVSDIHRITVESQGETGGKDRSVSVTRAISTAESTLTVHPTSSPQDTHSGFTTLGNLPDPRPIHSRRSRSVGLQTLDQP